MSEVTPYKWKIRVKESNDFLYEVQYDDYEWIDPQSVDNTPIMTGGCSAAHVGDFFGRNLDLGFNEDVSFVMRCSKSGCKKSIGMAVKPGLTRSIVRGEEVVEEYNDLPFYTMDGINEDGLVISTHVVPKVEGLTKAAKGRTVGTKQVIKSLWFPRYVLDNCSTVTQVQSALNNLVLTMETATTGDYNHHFLVADKNGNTICVEFHKPNTSGVGEIYVHDVSAHPWLTNFHITRADNYAKIGLKSDKTLPTPFTEIENPSEVPSNYGVEPICNGLERWNTLARECINSDGSIKTLYNEESMINIMRSVYYSNAYKSYSSIEERWCSEFLGTDGVPSVDVSQSNEGWKAVLNAAHQAWNTKKRDNSVWHTVYSATYDIKKLRLRLSIQEGSESHHAYQPYEESFDLYKKYPSQPTVAYRHDFVFDKDLHVLGNLYLGNSYKMSEPLYRKSSGESNGLTMIQPPSSYQQQICADPLNPDNFVPVKISMVQIYTGHYAAAGEEYDGYGYNIWMVVAKASSQDADWKDCQYIQTSRNCIKIEKETYGDDFLYQFWFNDFDFYQPTDHFLRFAFWSAKWNKTEISDPNMRQPDWNANDLINLTGGVVGDQVVRIRRSVYCVDDQGHEDDQRMMDEGGCFWVQNGVYISPIQQAGVPYLGIQAKYNVQNEFVNVNTNMRLIQNQIDVFNSMKDDLQIIVQAARDKKPWPPEL